MKYETIDEKQIKEIMSGKEPSPPDGWIDENGSGEAKKVETKTTLVEPKTINHEPAPDSSVS